MPRVSRSRTIAAPRQRVWELVSDPDHLARWWPQAARVDDVRGGPGEEGTRWTVLLESDKGTRVRADFRCVEAAEPERYGWAQDLAGTPFERILRRAELRIELAEADAEPGCEVTLRSDEGLRGLSRLGATMMRTAARRRLAEALEGLERALVGEAA